MMLCFSNHCIIMMMRAVNPVKPHEFDFTLLICLWVRQYKLCTMTTDACIRTRFMVQPWSETVSLSSGAAYNRDSYSEK